MQGVIHRVLPEGAYDLKLAPGLDRAADLRLDRFTIESNKPQGRCEDHSGQAVNPPSVCQPTVDRFSPLPLPLAPKSTYAITEASDRTDKAKGEGRWLWNGHWSQNNLHSLRP